MLKIKLGAPFIQEKKYIVETLLDDFLDFTDYSIEISNESGYLFKNSNNKSISFIDSFFFGTEETYLNEKKLPGKPKVINYKNVEYSFPYGDTIIKQEKQNLTCHVDIFASSFFFLTRWEECVISEKDIHKRFIDENSWLVRNNLHTKPLVNEYAELLSILLNEINIYPKPKKEFRPIITHDVDMIARYDTGVKILKAFAGDILLRRSLRSIINTIKDIYGIYFHNKKDNYDTFEYLMSLSESIGVKSRFYIIPGKIGELDVRYNFDDQRAKKIYAKILNRGHILGIHPSYNSYLNYDQLEQEKKRLDSVISNEIREGRQHYLRINLPYSWTIWNKAGLKEDSSVGYSKNFGFRAGSCYTYHVFDLYKREKLNLKENPLLVMDVSSKDFNDNPLKMIWPLKDILYQVKKHNGNFTILWHNSSFRNNDHKQAYEKIISLINQP